MELLGAGLGVDGEQHAGVASVFGGEVVALDFEFADGVHGELSELAVIRADVGIDGAVEEKVVVASAQSVDVERVGVVESQAEVAVVIGDHAGQGADQGLEVATVQAGLGDELGVDNVGVVGGGGFDERSDGLDGDVLGRAADLKAELAQGKDLAIVEDDAATLQVLHAFRLHFDGVVARLQGLQNEDAFGVGGGIARDHTFFLIKGLDICAGDHRALRIGDGALDGAAVLGQCRGGQQGEGKQRQDPE